MKQSCLIIAIFLLISMCSFGNCGAAGENYPLKPITVIFPIEPGGDGDINMRPLMEKTSAILGKPIVVVNKPGGGQTIGYRELYRARPDGYTIGTAMSTIITSKLQGLFPYDHHDFTILAQIYTTIPIIIAPAKTQRPLRTIEEVFSFARLHPDEISIATTAVGGMFWLTTMAVQEATGLKFNLIPQEGSAGFVVTQVAGGHTDLGILGLASAKAQIEAGNLRVLAIVGPQRFPGRYSNIPTLKELGYDVILRLFSGVLGPPKMPRDITDKLTKAIEVAANAPEYRKFLLERNLTPSYLPPDECLSHFDDQRKVYRQIMEKTRILKEK